MPQISETLNERYKDNVYRMCSTTTDESGMLSGPSSCLAILTHSLKHVEITYHSFEEMSIFS